MQPPCNLFGEFLLLTLDNSIVYVGNGTPRVRILLETISSSVATRTNAQAGSLISFGIDRPPVLCACYSHNFCPEAYPMINPCGIAGVHGQMQDLHAPEPKGHRPSPANERAD